MLQWWVSVFARVGDMGAHLLRHDTAAVSQGLSIDCFVEVPSTCGTLFYPDLASKL